MACFGRPQPSFVVCAVAWPSRICLGLAAPVQTRQGRGWPRGARVFWPPGASAAFGGALMP
eukprot:2703479-Lingulodinium_polyedra.AAC.1